MRKAPKISWNFVKFSGTSNVYYIVYLPLKGALPNPIISGLFTTKGKLLKQY